MRVSCKETSYAAAALLESNGRSRWAAKPAPATAAGWKLSGHKTMVPFASIAEVLLLSVNLHGLGPALVALPAGSPGVQLRRLEVLHPDPLYRVALENVSVTPEDVVARGSVATKLVARAVESATVLASAYAVGLCEAALALAVTHAKDRVQFGRPIGSFQTVANRLVDVRSEVGALRLLVHHAAWALDRQADVPLAVATMKCYANATSRITATNTHQVLGAMGFTMEHDLQLFTRRLKAFEVTFGGRDLHLEQVATQLGLVGNAP